MHNNYITGNIFLSKMKTLVNPVNCDGFMGKGLAFEFKKRYNDMNNDYVKRCKNGSLKIGRPYLYPNEKENHSILIFPTKDCWREDSKIEYIEYGLEYLEKNYKDMMITSIAFPALGCGLGGLDWYEVGQLIYKSCRAMKIPYEIYRPDNKKTIIFKRN